MNHLTIFNQGIIPVYTTSTGGKVVIARELHDKTGWAGQQTLVTPKGRETFRLLTEGLRDE